MKGRRHCLLYSISHYALLAIVLSWAGFASATTFTTRVEGLPTGLSVTLVGEIFRCTPNSSGFGNLGSVQLSEDSFTHIERVTLPSGIETFTTVTRHFYVGTLNVPDALINACPGSPANGMFQHFYSILGASDSGRISARRTDPLVRLLPLGASITTVDKLTASTVRIGNPGAFTSLSFDNRHTLTVDHQDIFGGNSVRNPSLELTRQTLINGLTLHFTVARAVINEDNEVCLTSAGVTRCTPRGTGSVTAGAVTVFANNVTNTVSNTTRTVRWQIAVNRTIGPGTYSFVARADDFDSLNYFVNGDPITLDLLPWRSLRVPVTFIN